MASSKNVFLRFPNIGEILRGGMVEKLREGIGLKDF